MSFALKVDIPLCISWTRYDPIVASMSLCHSFGWACRGENYHGEMFCVISVLQIQCMLLDVGANIATPMSSARESHISMNLIRPIVACFAVVSFKGYMFLWFLLIFSKEEHDLPLGQS